MQAFGVQGTLLIAPRDARIALSWLKPSAPLVQSAALGLGRRQMQLELSIKHCSSH